MGNSETQFSNSCRSIMNRQYTGGKVPKQNSRKFKLFEYSVPRDYSWIIHYYLPSVASSEEADINCIRLKHCPLALKLVETRRNDPTVIKFLRFSHCGFDGKEPMVWCNMFEKCKDPIGNDGNEKLDFCIYPPNLITIPNIISYSR